MKKILAIGFILAARLAISQTAVTNTGVLQVSGTGVFYTASDFTNNSGSSLTNNGQLYVEGALTNNQSSMAVGTGTLYMSGSASQPVNGTQPFRTFNFVSNNSAGIVLNNNLHVSGAHTFTTGIVSTSATPNYMIYEAGSSYSGSSDAAHVSGWVKKLGTTSFIFPVGSGTVLRPAEITTLSASSEFNARYYPASTPNPLSTQAPLRAADPHEYWAINQVSGGTANVHLNWNAAKKYFPNWIIADIVVAGYNGTTWIDRGGTASGDVTTTGDVTSNAVSAFGLFTFGSKSYVLPLNLIDFTASKKDSHTEINWTTTSEYNLSHFIIERSNDGTSFYSIGQAAARNRGIQENYQHNDHVAISRIAYYRLRCVDKDGKETLSRVVSVTEQADNNLILLTNPVHNQVKLAAGANLEGVFQYTIRMINGQVAQQGKLTIQNGGQYQIPVNTKLQRGTYTLEVSGQQQVFIYKLIIQ